MNVLLNGKETCVGDGATLQVLLEAQELAQKNIAVAVNNRVVMQAQWATTILAEGDKVTVIAAAYGG